MAALALLASAAVAFAAAAARADAPPLEVLAVDEAPVSYAGDDGRPAGYAVDVVNEIQRRLGTRAPVSMAPESRVYTTGLRRPNVVMLSFSRTREREASFHWILRIAHKPWVFYGREGNPLALHSLDDVRRLGAVAVVTGDVRAQWLRGQGLTNLAMAENHQQAIGQLLAGRVDVLFSEPQGIAAWCHAHGCGTAPPRALWSPRASDVYILMSKGTPAATAERWRATAAAMAADGTLAGIARRWADESARRFGVSSRYRDGVLDFCADARGC